MSIVDRFVEIRLKESEDFLKVKETLTRIGVSSKKDRKLFQSCHILHKQGKYYVVHFKQLFELDGKESNFDLEDHGRLNTIAALLQEWGLLTVVDMNMVKEPRAPISAIKIITHKDKKDWTLVSKYAIGRKR
jgi:hypothetical protein